MSWEDVVRIGCGFPGVAPGLSYGTPALKCGTALVTRLRPEDASLVLLGVPADERDFLIAADPAVFHTTPHYAGYPAVLGRLATLDPGRVHGFLERRWRQVAGKRVVARYDQDHARP